MAPCGCRAESFWAPSLDPLWVGPGPGAARSLVDGLPQPFAKLETFAETIPTYKNLIQPTMIEARFPKIIYPSKSAHTIENQT